MENKDYVNKYSLEGLLSKFYKGPTDKQLFIHNTSLNTHQEYYEYVYRNLNGSNYSIKDLNKLTDNLAFYTSLDNRYFKNENTGLFLSAIINRAALIDKAMGKEEKIQINLLKPTDCLFFNSDGIEAHINLAGAFLGEEAKQSKIYVDKTGYLAGYRMDNCELHAEEADHNLGEEANNSRIYVNRAGYLAGCKMNNCELHVNKSGNYLGANANNSIIYANETGYNTGMNMKNSKLYIKKLNGNIADSCFRGNNEIYLSKESYESFIKYCPQYKEKVKIWKE
jgi:hypothetical protein